LDTLNVKNKRVSRHRGDLTVVQHGRTVVVSNVELHARSVPHGARSFHSDRTGILKFSIFTRKTLFSTSFFDPIHIKFVPNS